MIYLMAALVAATDTQTCSSARAEVHHARAQSGVSMMQVGKMLLNASAGFDNRVPTNQALLEETITAPAPGPVAQIAPFGKEDTARELQIHASKTQDTLVDAVENAEVAEIKRSVF